ncbi:hypothetical protein FJ973_29670 [Mesorhizobium sp. B2-1-3]|uniref:hypothetical protein n=1 Tax=Mesorhizobium sp. B2-1-3 TaxID=2589972 RepID=UPI00112AB310|nr:hypothetical protein [Mesorhizobium sp. B2-1-3]TPN03814.1 hypothetical protein FJ973_29670 [Mesorhizobium sp. B2-1-3]
MAEQFIALQQGIHILPVWEIGCALIGIARNKLAQKFLDIPQASCMVFVDADISWKAGDLTKLAQRPQDVIGATYRAKRPDELFHVFGDPEPVGDLYKVDGLPGGFLKVSRKAYEQMAADVYLDVDGRQCHDYFPTGIVDGRLYGEDYGFCRLWRTVGDVWLDPSIILKHHDGLSVYTGDPSEWLKERQHGAR